MKTEKLTEPVALARQDVTGIWHRVVSAPCEECGCSYQYSLDEPGIILWEPGADIEEGCLDEFCDCHVAPLIGLRCKLNSLNYAS